MDKKVNKSLITPEEKESIAKKIIRKNVGAAFELMKFLDGDGKPDKLTAKEFFNADDVELRFDGSIYYVKGDNLTNLNINPKLKGTKYVQFCHGGLIYIEGDNITGHDKENIDPEDSTRVASILLGADGRQISRHMEFDLQKKKKAAQSEAQSNL